MDQKEYWTEIIALAKSVRREAAENGRDVSDVLHETLDGHEYVIYTAQARDVITHSDNADAIFEDFGKLSVESWEELFPRAAYCAMERDVREHDAWSEPFVSIEDCEIVVEAEQDETDPRGNASSIDPETDTEILSEINERLERGDVWAWAHVTVRVTFGELTGEASLGGCSYKDEADFRQSGGYFDDLVVEAIADLCSKVEG